MPSSHAQFVAFWSVSVALFLLVRHTPPTVLSPKAAVNTTHRPWSVAERAAVSAVGALVAGLTAWSRVYLNYHTTRQVLAGAGVGAVTAVVWFGATGVLRRTGWLGWALENPLVRRARVRDLIIEEDMAQAGWEKWEQRRSVSVKGKTKRR